MINIVIAMAGRGQRFIDAGYEDPKPFILIHNSRMIEMVLNNIIPRLQNASCDELIRYIFICQKSHMDQYGKEFKHILNDTINSYEIITVDYITEGAICSVLLAKDLIDDRNELIVTDADHIVGQSDHIGQGIDFFRWRNSEAGLWCFLSDDPKYSYTCVNNGLVTRVVEKEVVSNLANTGSYYFRNGSDFVKYAEYIVNNNIRQKGEFYTSTIYQQYIANNNKVSPFLVNSFISLGTPADLEVYLGADKSVSRL